MAEISQAVKRAGTAVLVLGLFAATAAFVSSRLAAVEPAGPAATPLPAPTPDGDAAASDVFFPTLLPPEFGLPDYGWGGRVIENEGCIWLTRRSESDLLVLWPHDWSLIRAADGTLRILDGPGHPVIDVGDQVTLHGGGYAYETQYVEEQLIGQSLPPQCVADDYFLTSGQLLYPGEDPVPG